MYPINQSFGLYHAEKFQSNYCLISAVGCVAENQPRPSVWHIWHVSQRNSSIWHHAVLWTTLQSPQTMKARGLTYQHSPPVARNFPGPWRAQCRVWAVGWGGFLVLTLGTKPGISGGQVFWDQALVLYLYGYLQFCGVLFRKTPLLVL